uniref:DNA-directed RNA polymerase n=2 Tax=Rhabditophanes sp. KR3021 TaxID=114890 RepID=A0AC35TR45_9BILA
MEIHQQLKLLLQLHRQEKKTRRTKSGSLILKKAPTWVFTYEMDRFLSKYKELVGGMMRHPRVPLQETNLLNRPPIIEILHGALCVMLYKGNQLIGEIIILICLYHLLLVDLNAVKLTPVQIAEVEEISSGEKTVEKRKPLMSMNKNNVWDMIPTMLKKACRKANYRGEMLMELTEERNGTRYGTEGRDLTEKRDEVERMKSSRRKTELAETLDLVVEVARDDSGALNETRLAFQTNSRLLGMFNSLLHSDGYMDEMNSLLDEPDVQMEIYASKTRLYNQHKLTGKHSDILSERRGKPISVALDNVLPKDIFELMEKSMSRGGRTLGQSHFERMDEDDMFNGMEQSFNETPARESVYPMADRSLNLPNLENLPDLNGNNRGILNNLNGNHLSDWNGNTHPRSAFEGSIRFNLSLTDIPFRVADQNELHPEALSDRSGSKQPSIIFVSKSNKRKKRVVEIEANTWEADIENSIQELMSQIKSSVFVKSKLTGKRKRIKFGKPGKMASDEVKPLETAAVIRSEVGKWMPAVQLDEELINEALEALGDGADSTQKKSRLTGKKRANQSPCPTDAKIRKSGSLETLSKLSEAQMVGHESLLNPFFTEEMPETFGSYLREGPIRGETPSTTCHLREGLVGGETPIPAFNFREGIVGGETPTPAFNFREGEIREESLSLVDEYLRRNPAVLDNEIRDLPPLDFNLEDYIGSDGGLNVPHPTMNSPLDIAMDQMNRTSLWVDETIPEAAAITAQEIQTYLNGPYVVDDDEESSGEEKYILNNYWGSIQKPKWTVERLATFKAMLASLEPLVDDVVEDDHIAPPAFASLSPSEREDHETTLRVVQTKVEELNETKFNLTDVMPSGKQAFVGRLMNMLDMARPANQKFRFHQKDNASDVIIEYIN